MKNVKIFILVFGLTLFLSACKGSKCDCPSFKPKGSIELPLMDTRA
jgi:hypothetical protein